MDPRKERALAKIASEHLLFARGALDPIGRGVALRAAEPTADSTEQANAVMESIVEALPESIRDLASVVDQEDGSASITVTGGTVVGAALMEDDSGRTWLMAAVVNVLPVEDVDAITAEDVNAMNARMPGLLFMVREDYAAYATGIGRPLDQIDRTWVGLVAELVVETHARSQTLQRHALGRVDDEDPISLYRQAEDLYLSGHTDLRLRLPQSLERYHRSLPDGLRDLVEVRQGPGAAVLEIPFLKNGRATSFRIDVSVHDIDHEGEPWTPAGLHLRFDSEETMTESDALSWVSKLNGSDGNAERDVYTMPWLMGNWCANKQGEAANICYQAFVSNAAALRTDLDKVIDGAVREVWEALNRLRLHREFADTIREGGLDVS